MNVIVFEYLHGVFPEYIVSKILLYLTHPCCDLIKRDLSTEFGYNEKFKNFTTYGLCYDYSKIFTRIRIIQKYILINEKLSDNIKNEWRKLKGMMHSRHDEIDECENSYFCNTVSSSYYQPNCTHKDSIKEYSLMMDEHQCNLDKFCKERKMIQNKLYMPKKI